MSVVVGAGAGAGGRLANDGVAPVWLVDWSDSEHEDFCWAWERTGIETRVLRGRPLGPLVGAPWHRLKSYPTYISLALRGARQAAGGALVAWQPLAGAIAGVVRRPGTRLVVLNPVLESQWNVRRALAVKGYARSDLVVFYTRQGLESAAALGLARSQLRFVPLGVRPRRAEPAPPGNYFLAAGRDSRDWKTLAEAASGLDMEVVVSGPAALHEPGPLRVGPQVSGEPFFALLEGAAAIVLPFSRTDRSVGQISMLAAMSVGKPIVATRSAGVEDYVTEETGIVVPPSDAPALRRALMELSDPTVASELGRSALRAARTHFSLERFVREVDDACRE
jgi:glycosyltransferase involved in cell wall biosynthesis